MVFLTKFKSNDKFTIEIKVNPWLMEGNHGEEG